MTPWVHGDGIGHFVFLHSVVIDRDFDFQNEYEYLPSHIASDAGGIPGRLLAHSAHRPGYHRGYHTPERDPVTGRLPSNWSIGPAIGWLPAYLIAHALSHAAASAGLPIRTDGYGGMYYWAVALTSFLAGAIGLLLAYRLAKTVLSARDAFWSALGIAAASPLLYYLYFAPSHSHAMTVLTASLFLLHWYRHRRSRRVAVWFHWGLLTGLLFLARWNDVVIAAPVLAVELYHAVFGRRDGRSARTRAKSGFSFAGAALGGFVLIAAVQFAVWQYLHGRPWVRHSVDTLQFTPAGLWGTLVSSHHGLFTWTPLTLIAVIGLFLLWRRDRELAGVGLAVFAALVISNCTVYDWWAGTAFGMRRMISATPLFVLGLAQVFEELRGLWSRAAVAVRRPAANSAGRIAGAFIAPAIVAVFGIWNFFLLIQFSLGMISHVDPVPFSVIVANQPQAVVRLVELIGEILR